MSPTCCDNSMVKNEALEQFKDNNSKADKKTGE
jgi:hypothetical protein